MPKIDQSVLVKVGQLENEPLPFICIGIQAAPGQYAVMVNPEFTLVQLGEKIPDEAFFKITFDDLKDLHDRIGSILGSTMVLAEENPAQQEKAEPEPAEPKTLEERVSLLEQQVRALSYVSSAVHEEVVHIKEGPVEIMDIDDYEQAGAVKYTDEEDEVMMAVEEIKKEYQEFIEYAEAQLAGDKKAGAKARACSLAMREQLKSFREKSIALDKSRS